MLSTEQVSSQSSIRKYDFQKTIMTSSHDHHYVFNYVRVSYAINWPNIKSKKNKKVAKTHLIEIQSRLKRDVRDLNTYIKELEAQLWTNLV